MVYKNKQDWMPAAADGNRRQTTSRVVSPTKRRLIGWQKTPPRGFSPIAGTLRCSARGPRTSRRWANAAARGARRRIGAQRIGVSISATQHGANCGRTDRKGISAGLRIRLASRCPPRVERVGHGKQMDFMSAPLRPDGTPVGPFTNGAEQSRRCVF